MGKHCSNGKCHHDHHGHGESCGHGDCCGHKQEECCDKEKHCSSHGCHGHHGNGGCCGHEGKHGEFTNWLYELGDCAWIEVLKEKIKEQILSHDGDRLKELAKIVAEGNGQRWKLKKEKKKHCKELEEKLCGFFEKSKK